MSSTELCLILAAGNGQRLATRSGELPKPLIPLYGKPILEHVMRCACMAGIKKFVIVIGFRGHVIREWYERHPIDGAQIIWVENPAYHKNNGISVLQAKYVVDGDFLLLMADHIFEPSTAAALLQEDLLQDEVIVAADHNLDRIFDLEDATKLRIEGNRVIEIGKNLRQYNAVDAGMFLASPVLFQWLEQSVVDGNCSLSDGLRLMAANRRFRTFDIGNALWQDIDTPAALDYAKDLFFAKLQALYDATGTIHV